MKVSLNWINKFTEVDLPVDKLVEKIGAQLGAVEEVIDLGKKYQGIVAVEVLSCQKHPNADKLSICVVDDGGVVKNVQRQKDGHVQIVCGAPNITEGMLAAWIPPGVVVPSTTEKDPFKITAKEIRGILSNGMLASPKELALGDYQEGLLIIDGAEPGQAFAEVLDLDDTIIDIENKMFTHRPDCFGMLGVAREIAGIQGKQFVSPKWYKADASIPKMDNHLAFKVKNDLPALARRFCVLPMSGVNVGPSPQWLQTALTSVRVRPINNVVDITNYLMQETAQPLHAYDYDKLAGNLEVRVGKDGEELTLLGGKQIKLLSSDIVIASGGKPVGLAAVMGGSESEVDENTKNIVLECGNFDANSTRRSSMQHGLFTDASVRFTKNQSPLQNRAVIAKAAEMVSEITGGKIAGQLFDEHNTLNLLKIIRCDLDFINQRLGTQLTAEEVTTLLKNVEFQVNFQGQSLEVQPPFWRTDIEISEDIVEEVGRLYGYDRLPIVLPRRDLAPAAHDKLLLFKSQLRTTLLAAGANEILTYSFVHGSLLKKVDQPVELAYQLKNALSPDLQYYRLSVMPSLLEKVHPNIKLGYGKFALFELGKAHNKIHLGDGSEKVPKEFNMLACVIAGDSKNTSSEQGSPFFQAKAYLDYLAQKLGVTLNYKVLTSAPDYPVAKPYEYTRSAAVSVAETGADIGMVGEFTAKVLSGFKLPAYCAGFEIGLEELLASLPSIKPYTPLPRFPKVQQDISLSVPANATYAQVLECLAASLENQKPEECLASLKPIDIYNKENTRHMTFRLEITNYNKTLRTEEVNGLLEMLADQAKQQLGTTRL